MSHNARERAITNFELNLLADRYEGYYRRVLAAGFDPGI